MTYDHVTTDMFDGALESIVDGMSAGQILAIPGAYEVLSEALNNDVLSTFDPDECSFCENQRNPESDRLSCCDGTGWTGDPRKRCPEHYEPHNLPGLS